jgi:peptidoglycan/LPS O-acetylase OafA/YrhL
MANATNPTDEPKDISYRPDIDGLRAIAVLSVIGYHLFPTAVPGGFIGVDIFFVISGYLISTIIITETSQKRFSFITFYARRAKRILPALISVSTIAMVFYSRVFFSPQIEDAYRSLVASFLFSANIYFYNTTGYFDAAANELPFLHYWSLGIEEQYYLFFPILALLISRANKTVQISLYSATGLLSLFGSEFALRSNAQAAYYLIPCRAWELMIGTLTYYAAAHGSRKIKKYKTAIFLFGLLLIGYSLWSLNPQSTFPGFNAFAPCFGTALIILSGSRSSGIGNRILACRPIRITGQLSYSLYLIHWPVFVIMSAAYASGTLLGSPFVMLAVSFFLAAANYLLVEQPLRKTHISSPRIVGAAIIALVATIAISQFGATYYMLRVERARHLSSLKN